MIEALTAPGMLTQTSHTCSEEHVCRAQHACAGVLFCSRPVMLVAQSQASGTCSFVRWAPVIGAVSAKAVQLLNLQAPSRVLLPKSGFEWCAEFLHLAAAAAKLTDLPAPRS